MKRSKLVNAGRSRTERSAERWIYGINAVERRLRVNPASVLELCIEPRPGPRLKRLEDLARQARIDLRVADEATLERLARTRSHQGVVARTAPFQYADLDAVLASRRGSLLVLDQVQDPHNLGALIRSAAAAGVMAVVIPRHGAAGVTPSVERVAAGAVNDVPICQVTNLHHTLTELRAAGYWSVALVSAGGTDIFTLDVPTPCAIVVGGESGMRSLVERTCDFKATIPMQRDTDSLNASVAGAVVMYELLRRSRAAAPR